MLFWLGAAGTYTPASHGTSVSSSAPVGEISRNHILSSSLDEIIDEYVKDHMFDDDAYDPVESIYREAIDDKLKGTYPKDLKETASSVLGQNVMKAEKKASGAGFSGGLVKAVGVVMLVPAPCRAAPRAVTAPVPCSGALAGCVGEVVET